MIEYEVRGKMVVILGCSKDETDIYLPDEIEGLPVTKIEPNAFAEMDNLKKITIPGSIKVIGAYAFASCPNLDTLVLEEGVETIEDWAFISCGINKISLPTTLKSIGNNSFLGNEIKSVVEEFMTKLSSNRRAKYATNNKCCVLPISMKEHKEKLNSDDITSYSKYVDSQFADLNNINVGTLDIPMVFDGDEFIIALYNRKPLEEITVELDSDSKMNIGLYTENDPEFLTLVANVNTKGQFITSFNIKVPYLENASFEVVEVTNQEKNNMFYYYIHVKANLSCFGNGNLDNQFAINQFDDLLGKYQTQLDNNIINKNDMDLINETVNNKITSVINGFLSQVDGAPYMTYIVDVYRHILSDEEINNANINDYVGTKLGQYYQELSDISSLRNICFDLNESVDLILKETGMTLEEIDQKYDTQLVNGEGFPITLEEALKMEDKFIDLESNYKLHADFINYIYKEIQRLNLEFSSYTYKKWM